MPDVQDPNCGVCGAFKTWDPTKKKTPASQPKKEGSDGKPQGSHAVAAASVPVRQPLEEPPDGPELGRSTWTFLHTLAAYYPDNPTPQQQDEVKGFITAFSKLYPCGYCADHMREHMKSRPLDTSNRKNFSKWMCDMHNEVNERLGKEIFDCSRVDERWRREL